MSQPIDITAEQRETVRSLLARHLPNTEAWVYGSRVRWTSRSESDLDIAVFATPDQARGVSDLREAFEESNLPFRVDLFVWDEVPESFRQEIERDHEVLVDGSTGPSQQTVGDLFSLQRGTTYKSRLLGNDGPVLLGLASIQRNGGFRADNLRTYGGECPEKLLVHPGELYVSLKDVTQSADLLGAVAMVPRNHAPGRLTQDTVKLEPKRDDAPLYYIHWLLRTPQYRHYCRAHATGTTNLGLPREDFLAYPVPDLTPTRRLVVDVLSALEDKIELNRRMNETLEAMARALFKSWFVDFEPVRAKMDGRDTGLPAEVEEAFPDNLDARGSPHGWPETPLTDVASFTKGRSYRSAELSASRVALLTLKSFERGGGYKSGGLKPYTGAFKPEQVLDAGELVVALTDVTQMAEVIGSPAIAPEYDDYDELVASLDVGILRPLDRVVSTAFLYNLLLTDRYREHVRAHCTGTTVLHLSKHALPSYCVQLPTPAVLAAFDRIAKPLMIRRHRLQTESRTLARLRNRLLPNLVSGEIRVPQAEQVLEKAL